MPRKGLGKGLDVLIPEFYDEDFDSNSTPSLEDMLNEKEEESPKEEDEKPKNIFEELEEEENVEETDSGSDSDEEIREEDQQEETVERDVPSEDISGDDNSEAGVQVHEKQINAAHVDEVKEIVNKNPRITLWSARSSAVFRYLRKTEPEFSISKEASTLIDEAVSKKYPEIWKLFDEY